MARVDTAEIHIASVVNGTFRVLRHSNDRRFSICVKYWQIIADNLKTAGWSFGYVSAVDREGRPIWIADMHRGDGKLFVMRAD